MPLTRSFCLASFFVLLIQFSFLIGYRYELYCLSKEYKTTHCIVECLCDREAVVKNNGSRKEDEKYTQDVLDALIRRYEPPDSRNRWDSPHVAVTLDGILFEEITRVLYDRAAPPPNLSTQSVSWSIYRSQPSYDNAY